MRTIVLVLLALAGISLTSADADAGAWCASYRRGVSNCGYSSYEQCRATVLGLGGFCRPNPFPGTAYGTGAGSWNTCETHGTVPLIDLGLARRAPKAPTIGGHYANGTSCGTRAGRLLPHPYRCGCRCMVRHL